MVRPPAVAGRFYPSNPTTLASTVDEFLKAAGSRIHAFGIVAPHAGYMYSGRVAGAVYSRIEVPTRAIMLCPNHTGLGRPLSIMPRGAWETPLGEIQIDGEMCDLLMEVNPALEDDIMAHRFEHALEVQLPFLQRLCGSELRFVPITVGISEWDSLTRLGQSIAEAVQRSDSDVLIIASSDMNHYESDAVTRVKDAKAIEPMLNLDASGLYDAVHREDISMCGFGPATAMILACRQLGATHAELVRYATSADESGDFDHVVGYAGIVVD
jgi:AmmeMemoRadiSam system protein B